MSSKKNDCLSLDQAELVLQELCCGFKTSMWIGKHISIHTVTIWICLSPSLSKPVLMELFQLTLK